MMNFRLVTPAVLVDINGVTTMNFIDEKLEGIAIGALTRHATLEDSEAVRARMPLVTEAMAQLGHRAVRNRGTMGGSLALAYPNAELPLLFVTLDAELCLRSKRGERRLLACDFIAGPLDTALSDDEFIYSAQIPSFAYSAGTAFIEISRRHGDFALAAAAAVVDLDNEGRIRLVQAGISGGRGRPVRMNDAERALVGEHPALPLIEDAVRATVDALDIEDNRQFPASYRRLLLTTVLQRALETAAERAKRSHVH
jgi:aerobic carbon-monoxide dehydrogenase medium subunit